MSTFNVSMDTRRGLQQKDRSPKEFEKSYLLVDELKFEDLLTMGKRIANEILFYGKNDLVTGNWSGLFLNDEIVIMAILLRFDLNEARGKFRQLKGKGIAVQCEFVVNKLSEIDSLYNEVEATSIIRNDFKGEGEGKLKNEIERIIKQNLVVKYEELVDLLEQVDQTNPSGSYGKSLGCLNGLKSKIWKADKRPDIGEGACNSENLNIRTLAVSGKAPINNVIHSACHSVLFAFHDLKEISKKLINISMKSQQHDPALSLFLAFLKLFEQSQTKLNAFTEKHRDLYYREILNIKSKPPKNSTACIALKVEAGQQDIFIPKGTLLSAEEDIHGQPMLFETDFELDASASEVVDIRTLNFQRSPFVMPAADLNLVTAIRAKSYTPENLSLKGQVPGIAVFGADHAYGEPDLKENTNIGFAVSSSLLMLSEGERYIELSVEFKEPFLFGKMDLQFLDECVDVESSKYEIICLFKLYLLKEVSESTEEVSDINETAKKILEALENNYKGFVCSGKIKNVPDWQALINQNTQESAVKLYKYYLLGRLFHESKSSNITMVKDLLKELLVRKVFYPEGKWLLDIEMKMIEGFFSEEAMGGLRDLFTQDLSQFFCQLSEMFACELSTSFGWSSININKVMPLGESFPRCGLILGVKLGQKFPAVIEINEDIHGLQWNRVLSNEPVLKITACDNSHLYPCSLFQSLIIKKLDLSISVTGLRNLTIHNQYGQLDTSTVFEPFGAVAEAGSFCAFGSEEMAYKAVSEAELNVSWQEFPIIDQSDKEHKGDYFSNYFRGYRGDYSTEGYRLQLSTLSNFKWIENSLTSLFDSSDLENSKYKWKHISKTGAFPALKLGQSLSYTTSSQAGFFKFQLATESHDFGGGQYPDLLANYMLQQSKNVFSDSQPKSLYQKIVGKTPNEIMDANKSGQVMPNLPFSPKIKQVSVNYKASGSFIFNQNQSGGTLNFFHIQPFNIVKALSSERQGTPLDYQSLLPKYDNDGYLFLGIGGAKKLQGNLSLYFKFSSNGALLNSENKTRIKWMYLSRDGWRELEAKQIRRDTTWGMLTSGIVVLEIPEDIERITIEGRLLFWLAAKAKNELESYGLLESVTTHAVSITSIGAHETSNVDPAMFPNWQPEIQIPGITEINSLSRVSDNQYNSSEGFERIRIHERLSHKLRPQTPKDYERIILQEFPWLSRVKCFSNTGWEDTQGGSARPVYPKKGHILILVVPNEMDYSEHSKAVPRIDASLLARINTYVSKISPAVVKIEVRNALYERLRVCCQVTLKTPALKGILIKKLNQDISDYLSPWGTCSLYRGFDWKFSVANLTNYIASLDYISEVGEVILQRVYEKIVDSRLKYFLNESNTQGLQINAPRDKWKDENMENQDLINGKYGHIKSESSWSLPLPMNQHLIWVPRVISDLNKMSSRMGLLEVGQTFVINKEG